MCVTCICEASPFFSYLLNVWSLVAAKAILKMFKNKLWAH